MQTIRKKNNNHTYALTGYLIQQKRMYDKGEMFGDKYGLD